MVDIGRFVLGAPEQDSDLAPVHEDEAFALVGHVGAHTAPDDTMPSGQVHRVELCLDDLSDVVEHSSLLESKGDAIHGMLLHKFVHIRIFDYCVFSLLLVKGSVGLHYLRVCFSLPIFSLDGPSVSCNLCD